MKLHDIGLVFRPIKRGWVNQFRHGKQFQVGFATGNVAVISTVDFLLACLFKTLGQRVGPVRGLRFREFNLLKRSVLVKGSICLVIQETAVDVTLQHLVVQTLCRGGRSTIRKRVEVIDDQNSCRLVK